MNRPTHAPVPRLGANSHCAHLASLLALLTLTFAFASCFSTKSAKKAALLGAAEEPVELAQLNPLLGTWDGVSSTTILETGEVFEARSVRRVQWEADGQFLLERTVTSATGIKPTTSVCIWTWDGLLGVFRSWRFDSHGTVHERMMHWDEEEQAWQMEMTSLQRGQAEPSLARGVMRFLSETEKEYEWTRYKSGSTEPLVETKGKSTRVSKD